MESPSSTRSSPSKALNPLSPDRMNQQAMPNSPSSVSDTLRLQRKSHRGLSDVQAKVAYLNNLSRSGSPGAAAGSTSAGGVAALQRAILGREEAESALTRVSSQLSEAQLRERRISERLESLLEEFQSSKERQAHERVVFEKEIRKARKEAFRAGSTLVKTQEELKHVRAEAKGLYQEVQTERESKEKAKQEAFERAYAIAGLTEELEELKGRLRTAEATNHSMTLQHARAREIKKQNLNRMSLAEGDLALIMTPSPRKPKRSAEDMSDTPAPMTTEPTAHEDTPPKKLIRLSDPLPPHYTQQFECAPPLTVHELVERLQDDLKWEQKQRADAEDMVEFMQVQCMFKVCGCRELERLENEARSKKQASIPQKHEEETENVKKQEREIVQAEENTPQQANYGSLEMGAETSEVQQAEPEAGLQEELQEDSQEEPHEGSEEEKQEEQPEEGESHEEVGEPVVTFSPVTGTFRTIPSPLRPSPQKQRQDSNADDSQSSPTGSKSRPEAHSASSGSVPKNLTPGARHSPMTAETQSQTKHDNLKDLEDVDNVNETHNVQTVPLRTEDEMPGDFTAAPGTPVSREQALAQIRARRGRTSAMKRSVSANDAGFRAGGLNVTPARVARRIPGVQHSDPRGIGIKKSRRDMSAPMRVFR
ncbi:hypothetical protein ASPVEDRAFT_58839 [Aspergillus versicolor CBS 583.65]|uniref:Uncharacterized protein n=1 Tax=Aspergillus versicolor CBS 583.65 TaxID=1036611 RepID=A0A1L9P694_ASPVE|nr:uncharacterized protein ASPVEDRAFT_58839 [Aspergillus versicolor CBS 583.65]OJI97049.1 hypothetical protein ASPVEDRAFT_58839 [Aspergillus versicolor CBS 583.65]